MSETDILVSAAAAAGVVICGGLYALFLALGRLRQSVALSRAALAAYVALVASAFVLADSLGFSGGWLLVIAVMLVGYLLAPGAIWRLSTATHAVGDTDDRDASEDRRT